MATDGGVKAKIKGNNPSDTKSDEVVNPSDELGLRDRRLLLVFVFAFFRVDRERDEGPRDLELSTTSRFDDGDDDLLRRNPLLIPPSASPSTKGRFDDLPAEAAAAVVVPASSSRLVFWTHCWTRLWDAR